MPKIIRLKPCPFCGAEGDSFVSLNKRYDNHYVKCFRCGASSGMCDSEETATEAWNERGNGNSCDTENGTVVSLPCKLGDTVWYISEENPFAAFQKELKAREDPDPIAGILLTKDGIYISTYNVEEVKGLCDKVNEDYAYLTKEDAEKAIEEKLKKGEIENV